MCQILQKITHLHFIERFLTLVLENASLRQEETGVQSILIKVVRFLFLETFESSWAAKSQPTEQVIHKERHPLIK